MSTAIARTAALRVTLPRPRIGIAAETRYLSQHQPIGLATALARCGHAASLLPAFAVGALSGLNLLVARGRSRELLDLVSAAEAAGVATMNRRSAIEGVLHKGAMARVLEAARVPCPPTWVGTLTEIASRAGAADFPLVVKPVRGDNARGVRVVRSRLELVRLPWSEPLALAQPFVPGDGLDLKLYAAGDQVWAVRKPSPIGRLQAPARQIPLTTALRDLALRCGRLFGLDLFGVDCIETPAGPVVIEVNDFPNYGAVEGADDALARFAVHRAALAAGGVR